MGGNPYRDAGSPEHELLGLPHHEKALTKVPGVTNTIVSYEKQEAVVTFDDAKANVEALTKATANAGYPSDLKR